ncbi:MAG: UbiA family prenyltransferase [Bacteroidetes bacterium]|nr:UbiA family prenyltransferase [Bacteroidota bacterium]
MIKRIWIYLKEMYPVIPRIILSILFFYSFYFTLIAPYSNNGFGISTSSIFGALTFFLFALFLRISDEFKDYKTDVKLFPQRPLPSGRILKKDLIVLNVIVLIIMIITNILFVKAHLAFIIMLGYGLLMFKYFFLGKYISKSLLLALITHNPIALIMNFYIISIANAEYGIEIFSIKNLLLVIIFWVPLLAWELSRKVKSPENENEYETYSMIFGYKIAAILPALILVCGVVLTIFLYDVMLLNPLSISFIGANMLLYLIVTMRFLLKPNIKTSNLRPFAEVYSLVLLLIIFANLLIQIGIK